MAWLAVDKYGNEEIHSVKPFRKKHFWEIPYEKDYDDNGFPVCYYKGDCIQLPKGTIKKIIGRELTWNDEPVEIKED